MGDKGEKKNPTKPLYSAAQTGHLESLDYLNFHFIDSCSLISRFPLFLDSLSLDSLSLDSLSLDSLSLDSLSLDSL
jgi:hypothetical protein